MENGRSDTAKKPVLRYVTRYGLEYVLSAKTDYRGVSMAKTSPEIKDIYALQET